jgi:hypothetical protein
VISGGQRYAKYTIYSGGTVSMRLPTPHFDINTMLHRKVKYVLQKPDNLHDALLEIVTQGKSDWDQQEWEALVADIESSDLTVGEYIKPYRT